MIKNKPRSFLRKVRHARIRKKVIGDFEKPRVAVFKSLKHIYAQVIIDRVSKTIAFSSTLDKQLKSELTNKNKTEKASIVGKHLAQKLKLMNIITVVFDRGGFKYHGRVKALAEAMREEGIQF